MTTIAPDSLGASSPTYDPAPEESDRATAADTAATYDAELVRRVNAGDKDAFVEIVTRYRRKLYAVAYRRLQNHADAEEIVQDTFVRAHKGLVRFRGDCSLSSWLFRIAINLSCNRHWYFFRRHRHNTLSLDSAIGDDPNLSLEDVIPSEEPGPANEAAVSELTDLVGTCMKRLGPQHRTILTLRNEWRQSYETIGATLGISVGTVKSRVARARTRLRQLLAETYGDIGLAG